MEAKLPFPEKYIKHGNFVFNSGVLAKTKCEVEEMLTDPFYLSYLLERIPLSSHYVGIETGGAYMAMAAHIRNPGSKLSFIKKQEGKKEALLGEKPNGRYGLVDDVTTTGGSLERAISLIGNSPEFILVAVDRREKKEKIAGLEVISVFETPSLL